MITAERFAGRAAEVTISAGATYEANLRRAQLWRVDGGFGSIFRLPVVTEPAYMPGMHHAYVWNNSTALEILLVRDQAGNSVASVAAGQVAIVGLLSSTNQGKWTAVAWPIV